MVKNIVFAILIINLFFSCQEDDNSPFPVIQTVNSQVYSTGGVKLEGNIRNKGNSEILDYGFELFANGNNIYYNVNHHSQLPATQGQYFLEITQDLYPDLEYQYTAYIRTELETYRGETLSFISNGSATPIMLNCSPSISHIGDTVSLIGNNFPEDVNDIELKFGGSYAQIVSSSQTEITFIVPRPNGNSRILEISAFGKQVVENSLLDLYLPIINNVNPNSAFFGETISITGDHFNNNINFTSVTIGGYDAQVVTTSRNEIQVVIPEDVNYSNTEISVFAQNNYVSYNNFNLTVPQFINVPNEVYTGETFNITVDKTYENQYTFLINDVVYYPNIIDDTTFEFYISNTFTLENREATLKWKINDIEIVSEQTLNIRNPFYKIKDGYNNNFPFAEYDVFTIDNKVVVIGDIAYTDAKKYIYTYNDVSRTWVNELVINNNGSPFALGNASFVYSEDTNYLYGLGSTGFTQIDIDTGNVTFLSSNSASGYYGKGFAYQNKIFYTTPNTNNLWAYDIINQTWQIVSTLPYNASISRNSNVSLIVVGDYVYIANGSNDTQYNDFWRMDLTTYQWEQLPDNPSPSKAASVYLRYNELHFVTNKVQKFNLDTQNWEIMDKAGIPNVLYNNGKDTFIQNNIPYIIFREDATNVSYLNLYFGDLVD